MKRAFTITCLLVMTLLSACGSDQGGQEGVRGAQAKERQVRYRAGDENAVVCSGVKVTVGPVVSNSTFHLTHRLDKINRDLVQREVEEGQVSMVFDGDLGTVTIESKGAPPNTYRVSFNENAQVDGKAKGTMTVEDVSSEGFRGDLSVEVSLDFRTKDLTLFLTHDDARKLFGIAEAITLAGYLFSLDS